MLALDKKTFLPIVQENLYLVKQKKRHEPDTDIITGSPLFPVSALS